MGKLCVGRALQIAKTCVGRAPRIVKTCTRRAPNMAKACAGRPLSRDRSWHRRSPPRLDFGASLVNLPFTHRDKARGALPFFSCVARPVGRKEIDATPAAQQAMRDEWATLEDNHAFNVASVQGCSELRAQVRRDGVEIHHSSLATSVVEKNAELDEPDELRVQGQHLPYLRS